MSKQHEADLILKLYDLRREAEMRKGRDYFTREFYPESFADLMAVLSGPHSGHVRMVVSYWEMAAALVNHGAIDLKLFNEANGEHFFVFGKIQPFLAEIRAGFGPQFLVNLERLIEATTDGRQRVALVQERIKAMRAQSKGQASSQS